MSRFRFSLVSFLAVITLLALGLAAMASQARLATSAAFTAFVVLLCLATAGAVIPWTVNRAFWIGFAIFGWTYWFLEFDTSGARATPQPAVTAITLFSGLSGRIASPAPTPQAGLLTADLLDWLEGKMTASRSIGSKVMAQWRGGTYYSGTITQAEAGQYLIVWDDGSPQQWTPPSQIQPNSPNLRLAAHATLGGLFALIGGVLVAVLFGSRLEKDGTSP